MISLVGYNENASEFPDGSIEMRPACTSVIRNRMKRLYGARTVRYLGNGFHNAHHLLSGIPNSPDLVVRRMLAPVGVLAERLAREYRVLEYLESHGYPHAPRPARWIAPGEIDDCPAFAMSLVEGIRPELDAATCWDLGRAVGLLHRLPVPDWLAQAGSTTAPLPILLTMWAISEQNFRRRGKSMPETLRSHVAAVLEALPQRLRMLDWTDATNVLLHADLGTHNLIQSSHGLVLLDWEFAAVSDPCLDLMWLWARDGFRESQRAAFFEGYGGTIRSSWKERLRVLRAMALVELAIWAQSGIDDITQSRNAHFFGPGDRETLEHQVARVHEATI